MPDGSIISGRASLNESAPTTKEIEDKVFYGTIVDDDYIEIIAEKVRDEQHLPTIPM